MIMARFLVGTMSTACQNERQPRWRGRQFVRRSWTRADTRGRDTCVGGALRRPTSGSIHRGHPPCGLGSGQGPEGQWCKHEAFPGHIDTLMRVMADLLRRAAATGARGTECHGIATGRCLGLFGQRNSRLDFHDRFLTDRPPEHGWKLSSRAAVVNRTVLSSSLHSSDLLFGF